MSSKESNLRVNPFALWSMMIVLSGSFEEGEGERYAYDGMNEVFI